MGWKVMGIGHGYDGMDDRDDEELRRAYHKGMKKGYEKAQREMEEDGYDDDDDDDEYGERYGGGGMYGTSGGGSNGGGGGGGYGERQGVRGTGPYSRVTRDGYVRRNRRRYY